MKSFKFVTLCFGVLTVSLLSSMANVLKNHSEEARFKHWLEYIDECEKNFEMGPESEAVLIMGNDGSGKTTLSLLLTDGDMAGIEDSYGAFYYADQSDCIATGHGRQQRMSPMLLVDQTTNTTYYDWTGFEIATGSGAVSVEHDILASHFMKLLAKSMKAVKFVFTASQSTLDPIEHMDILLDFVHRITDLIQNLDKYRDAIALVVTKVKGHLQPKKSNLFDWHTERSHIEEIAAQLKSARKELEAKLQYHDDNSYGYNVTEMERMKQLIDILLIKKDEHYQRIGIFQEPHENIPVKYMAEQQNDKFTIRKMINDNLHFVATDVNDFGYAVSKKTENEPGYDKLKAHFEQ